MWYPELTAVDLWINYATKPLLGPTLPARSASKVLSGSQSLSAAVLPVGQEAKSATYCNSVLGKRFTRYPHPTAGTG
jgi:hypothetical protein